MATTPAAARSAANESVSGANRAASREVGQRCSPGSPGSPYWGVSSGVPAAGSEMSTDSAPAVSNASDQASASAAGASKRTPM